MTRLANQSLSPAPGDALLAKDALSLLAAYAESGKPLPIKLIDHNQEQSIAVELPAAAVASLIDLLKIMSAGHGVQIIAAKAELSTFEAADILNVSRPYLIKLLDAGEIPHRKVGKHRRMLRKDVIEYKIKNDAEREKILDQLVAEAEAMGLYDVLPDPNL